MSYKKVALFLTLATLASCSTSNSSGLVSSGLAQAQNYRFGAQARDIKGPSNKALAAAEYRSDLQADTVENYARAQHAELGVVDHKLDTARRAQYYDHRAHIEKNEENKDDFRVFDSTTGSVSNTFGNINSALQNLRSIFE